jgi:hypothetical protein
VETSSPRFCVLAFETIDDAIERAIGLSAAEMNQRVEARLMRFAEDARAFLGRPPTP